MKLVYSVTTGTVVNPNTGLKVRLVELEPWDASDPFVKSRPDLFSDAPKTVRRTVVAPNPIEAATKAPGAKKAVKREEW
ncbi:MAG TPA: hypothetical protein VIG24_09800 [Acidimicrobiia bacterium]